MKGKTYQKWDVHHHVVPDFYVNELKNLGIADVSKIKWPQWSPEYSVKMMEMFHIEKAFLSISSPGIFFKDGAYSQKLSRRCNEYIAQMAQDYPGKFGGFASTTLPDVSAALKELEYALDTLKLDGVGLMSNVDGKYLGDKAYREFYAELDRRGAIIYLHPNGRARQEDHRLLNPLYLWQNDTTRTVIDFIKSGYHRDYPHIRWIFSHGGGILPPLYKTLIRSLQGEHSHIEAELARWKSQLFLDTASKAFDEQIPQLLNFSDERHVVFGSDLGWANKMAVATLVKSYSALDSKSGLSEAQIEDIFIGNARRLFGPDMVAVEQTERPVVISSQSRPARAVGNVEYHYHCVPQKVIDTVQAIDPSFDFAGVSAWDERQTLEWMRQNGYDKVMVSLDLPQVWQLGGYDLVRILRVYNEEVAKVRQKDAQQLGAFGAVDVQQPLYALSEIDYCLNELKLDGICLSIDISATPFEKLLDERIMAKLSTLHVPVLIHPVDSTGIPLLNENYLDAIYFVAKAFYLGAYKKYFSQSQLILTHTGGVLPYLAQPLNILFYLTVKHPMSGGSRYLWDSMVMHDPKGYNILMNTIVDEEEQTWPDQPIIMKARKEKSSQ
ncbi:amidohydrolase family protein [Dictyobacter alpinus]|uniref:amidohydrolase family protein n=1 Tax=Dictyobacter alpinus TaxID=2014873 RepID=UPI001387228E|nr:amidohydrolase family protein [Dictyobacter alpinus]